ncbi:LacI family DNA-binding transcriptional regulator [Microbacterium invictum]|uniref:LacI family DNA-binding transcriptional regulator n=1 Tax=Microbacterium invictum TaxID=515415 RepID=A0ABZ0VDD3_9MICO|nr:LacI family DNA-binding transcriptional regulator [Microbacterium invictum]WQB70817.1 LacI family DNA-binding transcriptional regulator [Microbacterium invictum]
MGDTTRVTLAQLAREAGVSIATMSKVLNGRTDVAATTRARIEQLLAEHGYTRRATGRRGDHVELVLHELEPSWSADLITGVETVAAHAGLSMVLTLSGDRHAPGDDWIDGALRRSPAAVILVFSDLARAHRDKLKRRGIPFVIVDPSGDPAADVPAVGSANWSGGLAATRHLIELGHRRIAAITGPPDALCSHARLDGYRSAMNAAGLPVHPDWVRFGDFHPSGGEVWARQLLALPDRPTAIFAGSDLQAIGVIAAARAARWDVPGDLSVVGYDDIPLARWFSPQLTTVHQPLRRMGEEATRLALRLGEGGQPETLRMDLATHLVVRESTAPVPTDAPGPET